MDRKSEEYRETLRKSVMYGMSVGIVFNFVVLCIVAAAIAADRHYAQQDKVAQETFATFNIRKAMQ